jgi:hypothetical protein
MPWNIGLQYGVIMQSVNELLRVFMLQARLERAMKQRHGARVEEERKFGGMRQSFAAFPESMKRGVAVQNT